MTISLSETQRRLFELLESLEIEAYAVGGFVRDAVASRPCNDLDLAVSTPPDETIRRLSPHVTVKPLGADFGTVVAVLDGTSFELTTFRTETGVADGRHPASVTFVNDIRPDLARRDFTVNAMAWSSRTGIIDPFGGQRDVADGIIRCVGNPPLRFEEDGLRILRGLRFASTLGYKIEIQTSDAIHAMASRLAEISPQRRFAELSKLVCGVGADLVLREYPDVLASAVPHFSPLDVSLGTLPSDTELRLCTLFSSANDAYLGLTALAAPRAAVKRVTAIHSLLPLPKTERELLYLGITHDVPLMCDAAQICGDDDILQTVNRLALSGAFITPKRLAVTPSDLLSCGVAAGPAIGNTMHVLCRAVIDGCCDNTKTSLLSYINTTKQE